MLLKMGSKGSDVRKLQEGLADQGFHPGAADGDFGKATKAALEGWQKKMGLYADGIFGRGSLSVWNQIVSPRYRFKVAKAPEPAAPKNEPKLTWVRCPADQWGSGYKSTTLRSDTAEAYKAFLEDVHNWGGIVTSAGGKRSLASKASPSRSKTSFHYTGRAFDMALPSGMQDPDNDPFIIVRVPDTRSWEVWAKVIDDEAILAPSVPGVTLLATVCKTKKTSSGKSYTQLEYVEWTGKAVNLTEIAITHGFRPIQGRTSFFKGGAYTGAEWWHFQWEQGLVDGETTFGSELLKVYTLAECREFIYWDEARDAVFQVSWF